MGLELKTIVSLVSVLFTLLLLSLPQSIESHFRPCPHKSPQASQIKGIDSIYLINLDKRVDRLENSLRQLSQYGIVPYRFSAICGRDLSPETLREIAVPYSRGMENNRWAKSLGLEYVFLGKQILGKPVFSEWMTYGAIGCALSHLSVLQDAYDSGYETIWVLEDDIDVRKDPHQLTSLIQYLDALTDDNWDILYTDPRDVERESLPPNSCWWMWRPDQRQYNIEPFTLRKAFTHAFIQVGSHTRTHSMIIRRAGIEKILNHYKKNGLYLPYDHEIAYAPNIKLYVATDTLVSYTDSHSDIQSQSPPLIEFGSTPWELYKSQELAKLSQFTGWCDQEKGNCLMDFIFLHQPELCVEIGTFGGSTTFPILSTLDYLQKGQLFCIDAWDNEEATKGLNEEDPNKVWWLQQNLAEVRQHFLSTLSIMNLESRCHVLTMSSQRAAAEFEDESIDLLYIDGNFSPKGSLEDVVHYFPKVKVGGYIWLNDASIAAKLPSVAYLMEHSLWLPKYSLGNRCIVFQKTYQETL